MWKGYQLCPQMGFYLQSSSMINMHLSPLVFNQFFFFKPLNPDNLIFPLMKYLLVISGRVLNLEIKSTELNLKFVEKYSS